MMADTQATLYQVADAEIRNCIESYLQLMHDTKGLSDVKPAHVQEERARIILLAGLSIHQFEVTAEQAAEEWKRRQGIPFDIEAAITHGVNRNIRHCGVRFFESLEDMTSNFTVFNP